MSILGLYNEPIIQGDQTRNVNYTGEASCLRQTFTYLIR